MGLLRLDAVRGIVDSNVSNLAAFTVASNDGITFIQGDFVGLVNQTTASQNGLYKCGSVSGGVCALTRAYGWESGVTFASGLLFVVGNEGTNYKNTVWRSTVGGTIGTDDPVFYPHWMRFTITVVAGAYTIGAGGGNEKLWLFSKTACQISWSRRTFSGSWGLNMYSATGPRAAGKVGTASIPVLTANNAGTTQTFDLSTYDVTVTNFG